MIPYSLSVLTTFHAAMREHRRKIEKKKLQAACAHRFVTAVYPKNCGVCSNCGADVPSFAVDWRKESENCFHGKVSIVKLAAHPDAGENSLDRVAGKISVGALENTISGIFNPLASQDQKANATFALQELVRRASRVENQQPSGLVFRPMREEDVGYQVIARIFSTGNYLCGEIRKRGAGECFFLADTTGGIYTKEAVIGIIPLSMLADLPVVEGS